MKADSSPTVLYYPTGVVHLRNLERLRLLPGWRFRVVVEPWLTALPEAALTPVTPADRVTPSRHRLPERAWDGVELLFLAMAYPNRLRLELVRAAAERRIPVVAVEEVNQLALNDGRLNHYILPLDGFGAASEEERRRFAELGWGGEAAEVTGWPFWNPPPGGGEAPSFAKGGQPAALLVLGSLKERDIVSLETRRVRRQILKTAVAGLPPGWRLQIKPHPIETAEALDEIRALAPQAELLGARAPIEPLLAGADLVINRGNSQAVLLAMRLAKLLAVIPAGLKTIFHGQLEEVIAEEPGDLERIAGGVGRRPPPNYAPLLARHWPLDESESLRRTGEFLAAAWRRGGGGAEQTLRLALVAAVSGEPGLAAELLANLPADPDAVRLRRLLDGSVTDPELPDLLARFPGRLARWHVQALLVRRWRRRRPAPAALDWLEGFDGQMNSHYFLEDLLGRIELELEAGRTGTAEHLLAGLEPDYGSFPFYGQAFAMLRFVYRRGPGRVGPRRLGWLLAHAHTPWARRVVGGYLGKR